MSMFVYLVQVHPSQFAEYGRTRRDLARAELFFAPFSFNYHDISRVHLPYSANWHPRPGISAADVIGCVHVDGVGYTLVLVWLMLPVEEMV